jgi:hypothetical protein
VSERERERERGVVQDVGGEGGGAVDRVPGLDRIWKGRMSCI